MFCLYIFEPLDNMHDVHMWILNLLRVLLDLPQLHAKRQFGEHESKIHGAAMPARKYQAKA